MGRAAYVIPVYQAQKEFEETMRSLANSSVPCAVFVVDDGSNPPLRVPDSTSHLQVHLIRLPQNQGIVQALNTGLKAALASGYEYIARIDAGDFASPHRLARQIAYFESHPECMLVGSDVDVCDEYGNYCFTVQPRREPRALKAALHERAWLLHPSVSYRASVLHRVGLYTDRYKAAEDYEMFLRIASRYEIGVVPESLLTFVLRKQSISMRNPRVQAISRLRIQLRYFRWAHWLSYYGVLSTMVTLLLPRYLKYAFKTKFLYSQIPPGRKDRDCDGRTETW
jgi:glycosyltransferase involved in cell wall biosynthesis